MKGIHAMLKRYFILSLLISVFGSVSQTIQAAPITYNFTGTVTSANGIWAGQGTDVAGFYILDDTLLATSSSSNEHALYKPEAPFKNAGLTWEISVTVGSVTRTTATNANPDHLKHHALDIYDAADRDSWVYSTFYINTADDLATLRAYDENPTPPDGVAPGTGNLTSTPKLSPGDLSLYDAVTGTYNAHATGGVNEGTVRFTLTSIAPVPIPAAVWLFSSGLLGLMGIARRKKA